MFLQEDMILWKQEALPRPQSMGLHSFQWALPMLIVTISCCRARLLKLVWDFVLERYREKIKKSKSQSGSIRWSQSRGIFFRRWGSWVHSVEGRMEVGRREGGGGDRKRTENERLAPPCHKHRDSWTAHIYHLALFCQPSLGFQTLSNKMIKGKNNWF